MARNGRSSRSYRDEGSWKLALAEAKSGGYADTWILIQFGHNDQPGKPGRSTDLKVEFPANLRRYVDEALLAGAHPILLTPLTPGSSWPVDCKTTCHPGRLRLQMSPRKSTCLWWI